MLASCYFSNSNLLWWETRGWVGLLFVYNTGHYRMRVIVSMGPRLLQIQLLPLLQLMIYWPSTNNVPPSEFCLFFQFFFPKFRLIFNLGLGFTWTQIRHDGFFGSDTLWRAHPTTAVFIASPFPQGPSKSITWAFFG